MYICLNGNKNLFIVLYHCMIYISDPLTLREVL